MEPRRSESDDLRQRIRAAAEVLKRFGASEVYLFGSAARGTMRMHSDIDFAVVGLPPQFFFQAMGEASRVAGWPVDMVDLERSDPFTRYLRHSPELERIA